MAEFILVFESLFFLYGSYFLFKKDRIFGLYLFFLFVYVIFAQVGYLYFSELSVFLNAYFGEDVWYSSAFFICLSGLMVLLACTKLRPFIGFLIPFRVEIRQGRVSVPVFGFSFLLILFCFIYVFLYFVLNFGSLNWYSVQDEDSSKDFLFVLFITLFKMMPGFLLVVYSVFRERSAIFLRKYFPLIFFFLFVVFFIVASRLGNRTDVVAFVMGVFVFESYRIKFTPRIIFKSLGLLVVAFVAMSLLEAARYRDGGGDSDIAKAVLFKDYYAPAHILFAAVNFNYVNPVDVLQSNFANMLILLKQPFLQFNVMELFMPGQATRSASYAFYVFAEGFIFMGYMGFLYNGIIFTMGLLFWRRWAETKDSGFNLFIFGLIGCMLVNMVRGQSSYFVKIFYMFFIPNILLYLIFSGKSIAVRFGFRRLVM